jgi:hypothetical protein
VREREIRCDVKSHGGGVPRVKAARR